MTVRAQDVADKSVAARLTPERQQADLVALDTRLAALEQLGGRTFAVVARTLGGWSAAVAFVDGVTATQRFVQRFSEVGTPSLWPCGTVVRLDVFGVNLDDAETLRKTSDQPRGTWLLATGDDALVDPTTRQIARAERRRRERTR